MQSIDIARAVSVVYTINQTENQFLITKSQVFITVCFGYFVGLRIISKMFTNIYIKIT